MSSHGEKYFSTFNCIYQSFGTTIKVDKRNFRKIQDAILSLLNQKLLKLQAGLKNKNYLFIKDQI